MVERPPVWLMRQAGRILPEYNAIRKQLKGFKDLVCNPELSAEVTIQPVDILGVDVAILFSDILVIPEAMGLDYEMIEQKGPLFPRTIKTAQDIDQLLSGDDAAENLQYVYDSIDKTLQGLGGRVPLIGFAGAPWTLFAYMIEGSGSKTFSKAKKFLYQEPELSHRLLTKITDTVISYLKLKISHGVHLVQVFDSWASSLSREQYLEFEMPYLNRICKEVKGAPITLFAKGAWNCMEELAETGASALGLDWNMSAAWARSQVGDKIILQGNMDPCQLYSSPHEVEAATVSMLKDFGRGHIANLGHGVYPDTPLDAVHAFVQAVKNYRYPQD